VAGTLKEQVIRELDQMSDAELQQMLNSARQVRRKLPGSITGKEFVERFGGTIPEDELDRMEKAIEEAFEQVEPDEQPPA
jgi:hypothetical protein